MNIELNESVGLIATEEPLATRVFVRHGIEFCCSGSISLQQACERKGLDPTAVLDEIRAEVERSKVPEPTWSEAPLTDLIAHILVTYHQPLHDDLPQLEAMARKVAEVHRDKAPEMLSDLLNVYLGLKSELEEHMAKEERILFPLIQRGQGSMAKGPVFVMRQEHEAAERALARLRSLTNDYTVPDEACATWRALWSRLAALDEALRRHMQLENDTLFPRALAGELDASR